MYIMMYNKEKVKERLRSERKKNGYTQEELTAYIDTHVYPIGDRRTVMHWESKKYPDLLPPLEVMLELCKLYHCDLGYLLCEYDAKTRPEVDIAEKASLSPETVDILVNNHNISINRGLDALFATKGFTDLLVGIDAYMQIYQLYQEEREKITASGATRENERMQDYRNELQVMEYNLDTNFREVLRGLPDTPFDTP